MTFVKNSLLQTAEIAGMSPDLPEAFRIELLGELFLSGDTRTYSPHSGVVAGLGERYRLGTSLSLPFPGLSGFHLPESAIRRTAISEPESDSPVLWVHPDSLEKHGLKNRERLETRDRRIIDFYPLASQRAVLFQDDTGWQRAKLHLQDVQISRYFRNLGGMTIFHCVQVSRDLKEHWQKITAAYQAEGTSLLPGIILDEAGTVLKNTGLDDGSRAGEWGSIDRSFTPLGLPTSWIPLPLFAFYGNNILSGQTSLRPLAAELATASGADPEEWLFRFLMEPVIRLWIAVFKTTGMIWEPHGQNVVMMCDPNTLMPRGVAFRDPDTAIAETLRTQLGLSSDVFFERNRHDNRPTREMPEGARSEISRVIDISMGLNTFDYLARLFELDFGCPPAALRERSRHLFTRLLPDWDQWFPPAVYGYAKHPLPEDRNCYPLEVRDGYLPHWRPAG
ncbi:MAG: hypothetical protein PHI93_10700 [Kiritimatiellae bacterium]|nr:hypothetical protein [Kiritimatiellia bacterium]